MPWCTLRSVVALDYRILYLSAETTTSTARDNVEKGSRRAQDGQCPARRLAERGDAQGEHARFHAFEKRAAMDMDCCFEEASIFTARTTHWRLLTSSRKKLWDLILKAGIQSELRSTFQHTSVNYASKSAKALRYMSCKILTIHFHLGTTNRQLETS